MTNSPGRRKTASQADGFLELITTLRPELDRRLDRTGGALARRARQHDVDATVAYVAPVCLSLQDPEYVTYFDGIGPEACRQQLIDFQRTVLSRREAMVALLTDLAAEEGWTYAVMGYDRAIEQLGGDRVLGGFPGVGGTWEGDRLLYADREKAGDAPFDRLILGEAHSDAAAAADVVQQELQRVGMKIERYVPIMAWHWSHIAMVLPLAGAFYRHEQDLDRVASDRALLRQTMRATAQALTAIRQSGQPILPRGLNVMRWIPAALGARRIASLLRSDFGRIALAAHASTARDEMRGFAADLLALAGPSAGAEMRQVLGAV